MRTRILNKMTANEVESYLERGGDTIFVAVGVIECHSAMPIDVETIIPEAYAVKMAQKADGLALINLPYYFAGGTIISKATVQVSVRDSMDHLKMITQSLVAQGFRKIFYLSAHGPARTFIDAVCRDVFQETCIHVCHINLITAHRMLQLREPWKPGEERMDYLAAGAYKIMGQMDYLPVDPNVPSAISFTDEHNPKMYRLQKILRSVGAQTSMLYASPEHHCPCRGFRSEQERLQVCIKGEEQIEALVNAIDLEEMKTAIDEYQKYVKGVVSGNPHIMHQFR